MNPRAIFVAAAPRPLRHASDSGFIPREQLNGDCNAPAFPNQRERSNLELVLRPDAAFAGGDEVECAGIGIAGHPQRAGNGLKDGFDAVVKIFDEFNLNVQVHFGGVAE